MKLTKKEILQRQLKGRSMFPIWKNQFEATAGINLNLESFLGLEESEKLRGVFFDKVRNSNENHFFAKKADLGKLRLILQSSIPSPNTHTVILFHSMDKYIGALIVNLEPILCHLEAVWDLVKEDLCVATPDIASGFCLESNFYDKNGDYISEGIFELTSWGEFTAKLLD